MTSRIEMFAIRNKVTGGYLPIPQGIGGRGGSHVEPVRFDQKPVISKRRQHLVPRMWGTKAAAKTALTHWLKGKVNCYRSDYWDGGDEENELVFQKHRHQEEMEIVSIFVELP